MNRERKPSFREVFVCPSCGRALTLHVRVSTPPTCANPERHTNRVFEMEKVEQE